MTRSGSTPDAERRAATAIASSFVRYRQSFGEITRRARARFLDSDWSGMRADVVARFDLYTDELSLLHGVVERLLGEALRRRETWTGIRRAFAREVLGRADAELAETFFNSLTRRVFATVGVDPEVEFVARRAEPERRGPAAVRRVRVDGDLARAVRVTLETSELCGTFVDSSASARLVAQRIEAGWSRAFPAGASDAPLAPEAIETLTPTFYRGFGAYLIGRVVSGKRHIPLAIALTRSDEGTVVDAALTDENRISIVFSFTRSYFLVDADRPAAIVRFLRAIMPRKRVAELYIALGLDKHGKTEFYRDVIRHLDASPELFVAAAGEEGLVMIVFTTPSYDVVFKVIRDRPRYPKKTTAEEVREKYRLVFRHDRAGRLFDAQQFEHLSFDRARFSEELLEELLREAPSSVRLEGRDVVFEHVYVERRVTPLNLHLAEASPSAARDAVVDYGEAIRELAASNIFPGDLLLKNFGVTRHGRVIFYDYDELCLLTDCRFRRLPPPRSEAEELAHDGFFFVDDADVFPEEFRSFLGLSPRLLRLFEKTHGELLTVAFWRDMQTRALEGIESRIYAYPRDERLAGRGAALPG